MNCECKIEAEPVNRKDGSIMQNQTTRCFWCTPEGICGPDISQPGRQVLCCAAGCKEYETPISTEDLKGSEK